MNLRDSLLLYVVSSSKYGDEIVTLKEALEGGATAVQLRMKNVPDRIFYEKARELRKITREYEALFIIDDRLDIALAADADGIHLGSDDLPVEIAKEIAPNLIIGRTVRNEEDARNAEKNGADYLGAGSVYPSETKSAEIIGVERLKKIVRSVAIPVVAIGGIREENVCELMRTGIAGIAMSKEILASENIREKTERIKITLRNCR